MYITYVILPAFVCVSFYFVMSSFLLRPSSKLTALNYYIPIHMNIIGRLGHGDDTSIAYPQLCMLFLEQSIKIVSVAAGNTHSLAVDDRNTVYSWGEGLMGQLGHGDTNTRCLPRKIEALLGVSIVQVAAGVALSVLRSNSGAVYCFGDGTEGGCGRVPPQKQLLPRVVEPFNGKSKERYVVDIAVGDKHVLVLSKSLDIYVWGNYTTTVSASTTSNNMYLPTLLPLKRLKAISLTDTIVAISASTDISSVLTKEGRVVSWGSNQPLKTHLTYTGDTPYRYTSIVCSKIGSILLHHNAIKSDKEADNSKVLRRLARKLDYLNVDYGTSKELATLVVKSNTIRNKGTCISLHMMNLAYMHINTCR